LPDCPAFPIAPIATPLRLKRPSAGSREAKPASEAPVASAPSQWDHLDVVDVPFHRGKHRRSRTCHAPGVTRTIAESLPPGLRVQGLSAKTPRAPPLYRLLPPSGQTN